MRGGHPQEALALATACWPDAQASGDAVLQGDCQRLLCWSHQYAGDIAESVLACDRAVELYDSAGHAAGVARTLSLGAVSMVRLGDAAQALEMLERAHAVAKGLGDPQTEFRIWVNMSVVHEALEEFEKAIAAVQTSLLLALQSNDEHILAHLRTSLALYQVRFGLAQRQAKRAAEGEEILRAALRDMTDHAAVCRREGYDHMLASMAHMTGAALVELGEVAEALVALEEGLVCARRAGLRPEESQVLATLGDAHIRTGDFAAALGLLDAALRIAAGSGDLEVVAKCHLQLSQTHELMGDLAQALSHYRQYHDVQTGLLRVHAAARAQVLSARLDNERVRMETALFRLRATELERDNHTLQSRAVQLQRDADEDPLTGLGNRRYFERRIGEFVPAIEQGGELTLAIGDIDHFKQVNDRFSHGVGDRVLQQVGALFAQHCRPTDVVARFGGEEFVVALAGCSAAQAVATADRLRASIEQFDRASIHPDLRLTISIGLAPWTAPGSIATTLEAADRALYAAKAAGRNRVSSSAGHPT